MQRTINYKISGQTFPIAEIKDKLEKAGIPVTSDGSSISVKLDNPSKEQIAALKDVQNTCRKVTSEFDDVRRDMKRLRRMSDYLMNNSMMPALMDPYHLSYPRHPVFDMIYPYRTLKYNKARSKKYSPLSLMMDYDPWSEFEDNYETSSPQPIQQQTNEMNQQTNEMNQQQKDNSFTREQLQNYIENINNGQSLDPQIAKSLLERELSRCA